MLVAVVGGTGFVGRYVVERLLRRDHDVRVLTRAPERTAGLKDRGVDVVAGSLADQAALRRLVAGAGAAVNLAGIILEDGRQTFERVHVTGVRSLVEAARAEGVARLVQMSALGARNDPAATAYHITKWRGEELVRHGDVAHVILRPSLIAAAENEVIRMLVRMLRFSPLVPVIGDGQYRMQPVWAEDVAEAFALAVERPELGGTFDIAGPEQLTYHQILDALEAALGVRRPRVSAPVPMVRFAAYAGMVLPNLNPISPDQLQMLLEGNTTEQNALPTVFGVTPRPFAEVAREVCGPYAAVEVERPRVQA
jgi:NADH dehydrogenase